MVDTTLGKCMPADAVECGTGFCPKGSYCSPRNTCISGLGPQGPICAGFDIPCPYGTACGPQGQCYYPDKTHICDDGKIYELSEACPN
jgi:hypothetical protein